MIKKTIFFTIFLLFSWNLFVMYNPFSLSQHQWQGNIISAEILLFDIDSIENIIVGSSLSKRLQMDSLPNFYNLSLNGQSLFDGLTIVKNKANLPRNIFIEINVIDRGEDSNFKEIVSSPILNTLKRNLHIFRTDKQPLAYVGSKFVAPVVNIFFKKVIYKVNDKIKYEFQGNKLDNENKSETSIFDKMLTIQKDRYSANIDTSIMQKQFTILKNEVEFLESQGVKIIFFEMPVNSQLVHLNKAIYLRRKVQNDFPNNIFIRIPSNIDTYRTSDGVHLTNNESKIYTSYFKNAAIAAAKE